LGLNPDLWNGKRVLVSGHTGFKGSWLTLLLRDLGAEVVGLSLPPESPQSLFIDARISDDVSTSFFQDIRNEFAVANVLRESHIDYVFHLAAQAYVRRSVLNPIDSITTNIIGTANVLISSLASESVSGVTVVTTDKVYENILRKEPFEESDKLGGIDPYSASKAASEIIVNSINISNNPLDIPVTTVRAGNVIGGGDWGQERLVPDLVRALYSNTSLSIRNPKSTRPWQHVLDCLYGYLLVGQSHLESHGNTPRAINFGPRDSLSVLELVNLFEAAFEKKVEHAYLKSSIPESEWLELNSELAHSSLGWQSSFSQTGAVNQTAQWYSDFASGRDAKELMLEEIANFKFGKW
jgi:CDP-glucose 4,6-dehydratase